MSLHAEISPEAQAELDAQKKTSTISSVIISLLSLALIGLILYVIAMTIETKNNPEITTYGNTLADPTDTPEEVTETDVTSEPATPPTSAAKVIAALTNSPDSPPTPTLEMPELSLEMTDSSEFSDSWVDGAGASDGGPASGFGSPAKISGTLGGFFYDFKQDEDGKPVRNYERDVTGNYIKNVKKFQRRRWSADALSDYYKGERELFVRYIAIPFSKATEGPRYFGVANKVKPRGWVVHYSGKVIAPRDGKFRFAGLGDDYLSVAINGRPHLIAPWHNLRSSLVDNRANSDAERDDSVKHAGPFGANDAERMRNHLIYGRWFNASAGEEMQIDIAIGENPGGMLGYILLIEEKGVEYKKQRKGGAPVLPPFVFGTLHKDDINKLKSFPNWEFKFDDIPVFEAKN